MEYGVSYHVGIDGQPVQALVEVADDEQDARDWAQSSGDPDAQVVCRRVDAEPWEVAK